MKDNLEMTSTIGGIIIWIVIMIFWRKRLFKKYRLQKMPKNLVFHNILIETSNNKSKVKQSFQVEEFFFFMLGGLLFIDKNKTNLP
jgi:hypothetical protein